MLSGYVNRAGLKTFHDLNRCIVLFITQFDVLGNNRILSRLRFVDGAHNTNDRFYQDSVTRLFFNASSRSSLDDDGNYRPELVSLGKILTTVDEYDYQRFPNLSNLKHWLKNSKGGFLLMNNAFEEYMQKVQHEWKKQTDRQLAENNQQWAAQLAEKDRQLAEKDRQLDEKDQQMAKNNQRLAKYEAAISKLRARAKARAKAKATASVH